MPKTDPRYTMHLHVLLRPDQHDFVKKELNGGIAKHVRQMIDATMGYFDKELTELEKEYSDVEPRYLFLKKRIAELKVEKQRQEDEARNKARLVEEAHRKLLEALIRYNYRPERLQKATYKVYSDMCGESVEALMEWVKEQAVKRTELE